MTYLTKNFIKKELECPCCRECHMDEDFLRELQELRDWMCRPLIINSGYRCQKHNAKVGGSKRSNHTLGLAVDISIEGWQPNEIHDLLDIITGMLSSGLGIYPSWVHFDKRDIHAAWVSL